MKIKRLNEMFEEKYDYDKIVNILKKTHGWGFGVINFTEDFEENPNYFKSPIDDNDYVEQFHIFLTDLEIGKMRGEFDTTTQGLRLGKWKIGNQVNNPVSFYSKSS
jgi:hypothetical protein